MTIAIGVVARTGVVIAADSQETVQGYWKSNQGKIWWSGHYSLDSSGCCAVAAAGRSGYCDALTAKILQSFNSNVNASSHSAVQHLIATEATEFHRDHVAPYQDASSLEVGCVVGYERNNQWGLFATDRGTVHRSNNYAAVGIGSNEATVALKGLIRTPVELRTAIIAAAYGVWVAKDRVDGCGNFTDIVYLTNHRAHALPRPTTEQLEHAFRRWATYVTAPIRASVLGVRDGRARDFNAAVDTIRRDIEAVDIPIPPLEPFRGAGARPSDPPTTRGQKRQRPSTE